MSGLGQYAPTAGNNEAMNLQRTSDFQAALLGMAGHDLRQPLQIIQSAYEWLGTRVAHTSEKVRLARGERAIARLTEQLDRLVSALRLYEHTPEDGDFVCCAGAAVLAHREGERERRAGKRHRAARACDVYDGHE